MQNVLLVSDDADRRRTLRGWVERLGLRPLLLTVEDGRLPDPEIDGPFHLLILDLGQDNGASRELDVRMSASRRFEGVPVMRLRDAEASDGDVSGDDVGAALRLTREASFREFSVRVRLGAEIGRLRRERNRVSLRDPMTGAFHRHYLVHRLETEFSRARRHRTALSLILLDIDRLRDVNDRFGEEVGDALIRRVGALLGEHVRKEDVLARTGEESFGFLLSGNRVRGAAVLANKIRTDVESLSLPSERGRSFVRVSAGVASFPDNPKLDSAQELVRAAERALREAKARGGNRVHVDDGALHAPNHRVLLVDADPALSGLVQDLLAIDDMEVEIAVTSDGALRILRSRGADLVIVDLATVGHPGPGSFFERMTAALPGRSMPVVGLARPDADGSSTEIPAEVDRFLTKPFSVSVLRGLIRELLEAYATPVAPN